MFTHLYHWMLKHKILCVLVIYLTLIVGRQPVVGAESTTTTVRVVIERVMALDDIDVFPSGEADFYAFLTVNGTTIQTPGIGGDNIQPSWSHAVQVDAAISDVAIQVALWDEDGPIGSDDHVDILSSDGRDLNLTVNLASCVISGALMGVCNDVLTSSGAQSERAQIQLRIEVIVPPLYKLYLPLIT